MVEATREFPPESPRDPSLLQQTRVTHTSEYRGVGSMPPPAGVRQAAMTALKQALGQHANLFIDKVGERLGFERTGVRL